MITCNSYFAFEGFTTAARGVMELLQQRMPMLIWMLSRVQGDHFIVLDTRSSLPESSPQPVWPGVVLPWKSTLCHQMVSSIGPMIAPDLKAVPSYANSDVATLYGLQAYVGIPLFKEDGALFGTLCGVSQTPLPQRIVEEKPLLEMCTRLLATLLSQELRAEENAREAERSRSEAMRDGPTGLYNRRAMQRLLDAEEARCRRYGHNGAIVVVDLNGLKHTNDTLGHAAGDVMIRKAADAIELAARDSDLVGRVGGDEFVVLAVECDECGADCLAQRIRDNLETAGLSAGLGVASRQSGQTLYHAMDLADHRMYADKRRSKASIAVPLNCELAAI